jgi:hypothetical protein
MWWPGIMAKRPAEMPEIPDGQEEILPSILPSIRYERIILRGALAVQSRES